MCDSADDRASESIFQKPDRKNLNGLRKSRKGGIMSEYSGDHRCHECDGRNGHHYSGCTYEGMEEYSSGRCSSGGDDLRQFLFFLIAIFGVFVAMILPPLGGLIIYLGAKITGI